MNKGEERANQIPDEYVLDAYDLGLCFPDTAVFIKEDEYNGKIFWGIYDTEGTRIAVTDNRECAFALARQNDFYPNSVH